MKKQNALLIFIVSGMLLIGLFCGWLITRTSNVPGVVCWGDSLTGGVGGDGTTYPAVLEKRIYDDFHEQIPVVNLGVGGEDVNTIIGRAGGVPFVVGAFTLPADSEPVGITLRSANGAPVAPLRLGDGGVNECSIAGVRGTLKIDQAAYDSPEFKYSFVRSRKGREMDIKDGTPVVTSASLLYGDYVNLIFIGQNGGWTDAADLIAKQKSILQTHPVNREKYLILGLTSGTREERADLEAAMQKEYGEKYINLREYLSTQGLADAGINPTPQDLDDMAAGSVPASLRSDRVHLNSTGYTLIAKVVYARLVKLNYLQRNSWLDMFYRPFWLKAVEFKNTLLNRYFFRFFPL